MCRGGTVSSIGPDAISRLDRRGERAAAGVAPPRRPPGRCLGERQRERRPRGHVLRLVADERAQQRDRALGAAGGQLEPGEPRHDLPVGPRPAGVLEQPDGLAAPARA